MELVAAIVLAAIILFYLRMAVLALNSAERYYTAFTLVLSVAVMCIAILELYGAPSLSLRWFCFGASLSRQRLPIRMGRTGAPIIEILRDANQFDRLCLTVLPTGGSALLLRAMVPVRSTSKIDKGHKIVI